MDPRKLFLIVAAIGLTPIALSYGAVPSTSLPYLFGFGVESLNLTHIFRAVMGLYLALVAFWVAGALSSSLKGTGIVEPGGLHVRPGGRTRAEPAARRGSALAVGRLPVPGGRLWPDRPPAGALGAARSKGLVRGHRDVQVCVVDSTDRRNTGGKSFGWCLVV